MMSDKTSSENKFKKCTSLMGEIKSDEKDSSKGRRVEYESVNMVQLFERQALKTPHSLAVKNLDKSWTYKSLNGEAVSLAAALGDLNVKAQTFVGVLCERSIGTLISILGIWKIGSCYVPLDSAFPNKNIKHIINETELDVIVVDRSCKNKIPKDFTGKVLLLDNVKQVRVDNIQYSDVGDHTDLAVIFYTSGSTGMPKGVKVNHEYFCKKFNWSWREYPFNSLDVMAQKTTVNFVVSMWEFLGGLLKGIPTIILSDEEIKYPENLVAAIWKNNITQMLAVPSLLKMLLTLDSECLRKLLGLRLLISLGGVFPCALYKEINSVLPYTKIVNEYGCSEMFSIAHYNTSKENTQLLIDNNIVNMPIGRQVDNTIIYLVDDNLHLVGSGETGEMAIEAKGMSLGYLIRKEETQAKFINNPFGNKYSDKLYLTGDLGRYLSDGTIEIVGRKDNQVKIRGKRIEIEGIESLILKENNVLNCAVAAHEEDSGELRLNCYLETDLPECSYRQLVKTIKESLNKTLPDYMIPSTFTVLKKLPMTINGKLARRELPKPSPVKEVVYEAPNSSLEEEILLIWKEVLDFNQIGVTDDFFSIGGDSFSIMQLYIKIKKKFRVAIDVNNLSNLMSIRQQAQELSRLMSMQKEAIGRGLPEEENKIKLLMPPKIWEFDRLSKSADEVLTHQAVFVLCDVNLNIVDFPLLEKTLNILVNRFDSLRTRFYRDKVGLQVVEKEAPVDFTIAHIKYPLIEKKYCNKVLDNACNELMASFEFTLNSPMFKVCLMDFGNERQKKLAFIWHHWIVDYVGVKIFFSELSMLYNDLKTTEKLEKSNYSKGCTLSEWVLLQVEYAKYKGDEEAEYWLELPWNKVVHPPKDDESTVSFLAEEASVFLTKEELKALSKIWNSTPLTTEDNKVLRGLNTSCLSVAQTSKLLSVVSGEEGYGVSDIIMLAIYRSINAWQKSEYISANLYMANRTENIFHLDAASAVFGTSYTCPILINEKDSSNTVSSLNAIARIRNNIPNKGFTFSAVKEHTLNGELRTEMKNIPIPLVDINYIPSGKESSSLLVEGLSLDQSKRNLVGTHPDSNNSKRIYFHIDFDQSTGAFRAACVTKGYDYEGSYFKSEYHPARSVLLSRRFLESMSNIVSSLHSTKPLMETV